MGPSHLWPPGTGKGPKSCGKQNRAARFVTGNYVFETGSMTGILSQLKWESLKKRRKDSRLILLYKGPKDKTSIPIDDLTPKNRRCRNQHSWLFRYLQLAKKRTKVVSFHRLSGTGMTSLIV